MKPLFFIICIFSTSIGYSQLYIENDAYIFVNDNVIFSTDYVNLNNADSKLYLRNDAQLIQGNGITGNSGIGELSVQQRGTVNAYAYNYWCSPVGNNSNAFGNEPSRVNLIDESTGLITSNNAFFTSAYEGLASPLTISRRWLYTYQTSSQYSDWNLVGDAGNIAPGLGFTMKGIGNGAYGNQLYDFRGKPNNGTITNNVAAPVSGEGQMTLIGNPYPSAIDARNFIHDTQNSNVINGALYYWEQASGQTSHYLVDYLGGYATYTINNTGAVETFTPAVFSTYNGDGTLNNPGASSTSGKTARRYIPIGQGFMVEGTATGSVRTTNDMRAYYRQSDVNSEFFRMAQSSESSDTNDSTIPEDFKRFRIRVDFNDIYTRELVLNFHDSATEGFDYGLEAKSPEGVASDAYWILNNIPYVIQAHAFDIALTIPLVTTLNEQKSLRFRINDIQNFDDLQPIYLHDKEANLYINLRTQDYNINIAQGNYTERFEITFTNSTLNNDTISADDFKVFQNNQSLQLTVLNPNNIDIKDVTLYDISGKRVMDFKNLEPQSSYYFSTKNLSEGVYIVNIVSKNNSSVSKKIVVKLQR